MSNQKQKERKKKQKERETKRKILVKRAAMRREAKEKKMEEEKWDSDYKASVGKQKPYRNPQSEEEVAERAEYEKEIMEKLQANIEILQALETEYEKEQAGRKMINDQLEAEGFTTVKEKMDAMHKKALEHQGHDEETVKQLTGDTDLNSETSSLDSDTEI